MNADDLETEVLQPFADLDEDVPVAVLHPDGSPRLVAARCDACGTSWFPLRPVCPSCAAPDPEQYLIGPTGTLYSYSTVHISSARPTPYTLGYVDLHDSVRVLATIEAEDGALKVDAPCHLELRDDGGWCFVVEET